MLTMEFLENYLHLKRIDAKRLSVLMKSQILDLLNLGSPDRVIEEIVCLEGMAHSSTMLYSPVSRHYSEVFKIKPSLPLTSRPAIFIFDL